MSRSIEKVVDVRGSNPSEGTGPRALAAWRLGRRLNELRWLVGRAWVLHDRRLADEACRIAAGLPDEALAFGPAAPAADRLLALAEAVAEDPAGGFGSLEHHEDLLAERFEVRRLDRLGEFPLPTLQQQACRRLVRTAVLPIEEVLRELAGAMPDAVSSVLRLAEHVDCGLRPTGDVADMFAWQEAEEDAAAAAASSPGGSLTDWFRPTRGGRPATPESPMPLCLGPSETPDAVSAAWSRALLFLWRESPIPVKWCPLNGGGRAAVPRIGPASLTELLDAIVTQYLADPSRAPIRWDLAGGRLGIGPVTLRRVRPQAYRVKELFQHFEDHGWVTPLPRPLDTDAQGTNGALLPWDDQTWKSTQTSLGKGPAIRHIKFESEATQISWRWDV